MADGLDITSYKTVGGDTTVVVRKKVGRHEIAANATAATEAEAKQKAMKEIEEQEKAIRQGWVPPSSYSASPCVFSATEMYGG